MMAEGSIPLPVLASSSSFGPGHLSLDQHDGGGTQQPHTATDGERQALTGQWSAAASSPPSSPALRPPPAAFRPPPLQIASPVSGPVPVSGVPGRYRPFLYLLCLCSFFLDFRPSEPYLTPYLMWDKGLGAAAVNEKVYPVWTYSYFAFLLPVGALGELLGYRPMIALQLLSLLFTNAVLLWGDGVDWMQLMQVSFGFASAVQSCVFFTYVYTAVDHQCFHTVVRQQDSHHSSAEAAAAACWALPDCCAAAAAAAQTGYQRSASLVGHVLGALTGQLLVWSGSPRWQLFIPTLTAISIALVAFAFIASQPQQADNSGSSPPALQRLPPPVLRASAVSSAAQRDGATELLLPLSPAASPAASQAGPALKPPSSASSSRRSLLVSRLSRLSGAASLLAAQYRQPSVRLFSLYLITGNAVLELVLNYDTSLFYEIEPQASSNGLVLAAGWMLAAAAAFLTSVTAVVAFVSLHPCVVLSALPACAGCLLLLSSWAESLYLAYLLFVLFYAVMSFLLCVSCCLIASGMSISAFALLFSVNTFASLAVQSLVQLAIGEHGALLDIRQKYLAFALQMLAVSAVFTLIGAQRRIADIAARATHGG